MLTKAFPFGHCPGVRPDSLPRRVLPSLSFISGGQDFLASESSGEGWRVLFSATQPLVGISTGAHWCRFGSQCCHLVTCTRARTGIAIPAVPTEFDGGALALAQGRGECTSPGPSLPPYMEQV